jgi:hypothetical protein
MKIKHYASRHEFKTRVVVVGSKGRLIIGHQDAKKAVEERIGRRLHPETKVKKKAGNWCFIEPSRPTPTGIASRTE